jgi:hypothetical protein
MLGDVGTTVGIDWGTDVGIDWGMDVGMDWGMDVGMVGGTEVGEVVVSTLGLTGRVWSVHCEPSQYRSTPAAD